MSNSEGILLISFPMEEGFPESGLTISDIKIIFQSKNKVQFSLDIYNILNNYFSGERFICYFLVSSSNRNNNSGLYYVPI